MTTLIIKIRLVIVLVAMLTLPGWAALSLSSLWRQWKALQRWIVAVGLSIAFYPILFYGIRSVLPFLTLGPYKMSAILLVCAALIAWRMRRHWKKQFELDQLEWIAVAVFAMTLFTRFWIIRGHPYPAWSDSLHHAILTRLTAFQGQLPRTMEPYFPIPLGQYHLGLYSLTATTQWLAQVPAHMALLCTAQALNGLCGLGIYLVLDRKVGRVGAIVGAVSVGLLSHQPAFYVNWGRFTQLSAQTILLIAWLVTWEALEAWKLSWREQRCMILWHTLVAAVLTGAVFLFHFRVAAFYLPLLAVISLYELCNEYRTQRLSSVGLGIAAVGLASLFVAAPALVGAASTYVSRTLSTTSSSQTMLSAGEVSETIQRYYEFRWAIVPYLAGDIWLLILAGLSAAVGIVKQNKLVAASVVWSIALYLMGKAYLLSLPLLSFTNLGAVLIAYYLPVGMVMGSATEEVLRVFESRWHGTINVVIALALTGGFIGSHARVEEIEPYRFFITPQDVAAMTWIRQNTPQDALFAVNTHFWLPRAPHGTDGGYWIPYFTNRQTTAGAMLLGLAKQQYVDDVVEMSRAIERLEVSNKSLIELQMMGVDYIYIGRQGDFSGPGLQATQLTQAEHSTLVYQNAGVSIVRIEPLDETG